MSYIIERVPIESVNLNPANPRKILDDQFEKLKNSIKKFPKMLELRPLVLNDKNQVIGGNMRLLAMIKLGFKEVFIVRAADLTEEEVRQFVILDNLSFGFWDFDMLGVQYSHDEIVEMGFPDFDIGVGSGKDDEEDEKGGALPGEKKPTIKITFDNMDDLESAKGVIEDALKQYRDLGVNMELSISGEDK